MNWLVLVSIGAIFLSLATLFQRILLKEEQSDSVTYGFVFQILTALLMFIYSLFSGFSLPPLKPHIPFLISMALLYAFANLTLFRAFQKAEASEVAVIAASKSIWTVIAAAIFLQEAINSQRIIGTLLVVAGIAAISWRPKKWKLNQGHLLAFVSAIFFGFGFTNDAFLLNSFDVAPYLVLGFFLPALVIFFLKPTLITKLKLFGNKQRLTKMSATSFFYGIASLSVGLAYKLGGDASQIAPIIQSSIVLTVVLAYIFLKESDYLLNKIIGTGLVFGGVLLLT
jgi:uncharacterized membrane protein